MSKEILKSPGDGFVQVPVVRVIVEDDGAEFEHLFLNSGAAELWICRCVLESIRTHRERGGREADLWGYDGSEDNPTPPPSWCATETDIVRAYLKAKWPDGSPMRKREMEYDVADDLLYTIGMEPDEQGWPKIWMSPDGTEFSPRSPESYPKTEREGKPSIVVTEANVPCSVLLVRHSSGDVAYGHSVGVRLDGDDDVVAHSYGCFTLVVDFRGVPSLVYHDATAEDEEEN